MNIEINKNYNTSSIAPSVTSSVSQKDNNGKFANELKTLSESKENTMAAEPKDENLGINADKDVNKEIKITKNEDSKNVSVDTLKTDKSSAKSETSDKLDNNKAKEEVNKLDREENSINTKESSAKVQEINIKGDAEDTIKEVENKKSNKNVGIVKNNIEGKEAEKFALKNNEENNLQHKNIEKSAADIHSKPTKSGNKVMNSFEKDENFNKPLNPLFENVEPEGIIKDKNFIDSFEKIGDVKNLEVSEIIIPEELFSEDSAKLKKDDKNLLNSINADNNQEIVEVKDDIHTLKTIELLENDKAKKFQKISEIEVKPEAQLSLTKNEEKSEFSEEIVKSEKTTKQKYAKVEEKNKNVKKSDTKFVDYLPLEEINETEEKETPKLTQVIPEEVDKTFSETTRVIAGLQDAVKEIHKITRNSEKKDDIGDIGDKDKNISQNRNSFITDSVETKRQLIEETNETEKPVIKEQPKVVETPKETEKPVIKEQPKVVETTKETEKPVIKEQPKVVETPKELDKPVAKEQSKVVETPKETEKPVIKEQPKVVETPKETEKPVIKEQPKVVETPKETEKPVIKEQPKVVETPKELVKPVEKEQPKVIETSKEEVDKPITKEQPKAVETPKAKVGKPITKEQPKVVETPKKVVDKPITKEQPKVVETSKETEKPVTKEKPKTVKTLSNVEIEQIEQTLPIVESVLNEDVSPISTQKPERKVVIQESKKETLVSTVVEDTIENEEIIQSKTKTVTTEDGIKKVDKKTNVVVETVVKYETVVMDKSDVDFFAKLVENGEVEMNKVQHGEKSVHVSKTLADLIAKSMHDNKPIRIDFDNNISIIIKVSREGKISADFLPSSQVAEAYLKENLPILKQKFDDNNIEYDELNQRKQNKQDNQENKRKGRKNE